MPSTSATSAPPSRTLQVLLLAACRWLPLLYGRATIVQPRYPQCSCYLSDFRPKAKTLALLILKAECLRLGFQLYNSELYLSDFPTCDLVPNLGFGPQYTAATSKRVLLNRITQASLMGLNGCWIKVVVPIRPCTQSV